jgi:hypothetical protein
MRRVCRVDKRHRIRSHRSDPNPKARTSDVIRPDCQPEFIVIVVDKICAIPAAVGMIKIELERYITPCTPVRGLIVRGIDSIER